MPWSQGLAGATSPVVPPIPPTFDFFVAPTGGTGTGSIIDPFSLSYALSGAEGKIIAGERGALRAGTYFGSFGSTLTGTAGNPIILQSYPGERPVLEGNGVADVLTIGGSNTQYRGFEIGYTPYWKTGINCNAAGNGVKLINLVVHDVFGNGIGAWGAEDEIYGCIAYNNGTHAYNDHGIYALNNSVNSGTKLLKNNISWNNWAYGVHLYGSGSQSLTGLNLQGNIVFNNGVIGADVANELLIGGDLIADGITLTNNYIYRTAESVSPLWANTGAVELGHAVYARANGSVVAQDNYIVGGLSVSHWSAASINSNTLYDYTGQLLNNWDLTGHTYSGNTFYGNPAAAAFLYRPNAAATFTAWKLQTGFTNAGGYGGATPPDATFVTPNAYEVGRGQIVIYNWSGASTVAVDLSGVLSAGQNYEIRNVQDFFGVPVVTGTYPGGGNVNIPMAGITPPAPLGTRDGVQPAPTTGPTYQVFVVRLAGA